jgi:predicted dehydrogenase
MTFDQPYGHTPLEKAFGGDVYGVGYDAARAGRRPVRLGVVGAGGVAQSKYFPAVARLRMIWEPIQIAAFAEVRRDHAEKIQAIYGGTAYPNIESMLRNESLDGVLVLSPDALHAEHAHACIARGLAVLVEKPITRSLADAVALCRAADAAGVPLLTVANKRFSPPYQRAKRLIEDGRISAPALLAGKFNLGYRDVDLFEAGTIHLFDLARFFMGDVRSVSAAGVNAFGSAYPVDNAAITLRFASGAVGSLISSASALSFKPWERVEIYGDHAWIAVDDQHTLTLYDSETGGAQSWQPAIPNTLWFDEEFGGYMGLVAHFAQVIRGVEAPLVTGWDGCRAFEVLRAVQMAIRFGAWIDLPLDAEAADMAAERQ